VALSKPYLGQAEGPLTVRIEGKGRTFIVNLPAVARAEYLAAIANWPDNAVPRARRVQLGVQYKPVGAEMLGQIAPGYTTGHLVMGVAPLSLAEVSGIKVGDVIVQIDGQATPAGEVLSDLAQAWTSTNPGRLTVLRAGKPTEVTIAPR
jgi:S1-C subfamily serine protease